jgi:PAS domain S-box-containing protein
MVDTARSSPATSLRRDAILEAVAFAAEQLLLAPDWRDAVDRVLARLGIAADVSRAYVIQNHRDEDGRGCCRQLAEWCATGVTSQMGNPDLVGTPWDEIGFGRWVGVMSTGGSVAGRVDDLPTAERSALARQDILSIAAFPVLDDDDWWGLIGFDDCSRDREWSGAELDALRAAASVLGAAIHRHRIDAQASEAEARSHHLVERIPAVTYTDIPGPDGVVMGFVSPQVTSILGYPPAGFTDDPRLWVSLMHPDDRVRLRTSGALSPNDPAPFDEEYRMLAADGRWVWIHDTSTAVFDDAGNIDYFLGFATDVTQRREAEDRLRATEEQFRLIVEQTPGITYQEVLHDGVYDPESIVCYVSPRIEQLLGVTPAEWKQFGFWSSAVHPDDRQAILAESGRVIAAGETTYRQEYRMIAKDGGVLWFHDESRLVTSADGSPILWQGVMVDITERKASERELLEARERLQALLEHIPAVVYVQSGDQDPTKFYLSPQVQETLGYTADEWTRDPSFWSDRIHPDDRDEVLTVDERTDATKDLYSIDYRFRRADETYVWVHDEAVFIQAPGGEGFWQGFIFDITERKEAEGRLRDAEQRFRTIVEQSEAVFYTRDIDPGDSRISRTTYIAPGNADLLGYSVEEVQDDPLLWRRILHSDDRQRVLDEDARCNIEQEDRFSLDYRVLAKDGRTVWIQDEARRVRLPGRPPYWQGFLLDVTERKEAETQLERALAVEREATQRLRALDEMKNTFLQAVSHDLRTPLAAILGLAITLARGDVHLEESDARDLARRIAENARRLDRLVTNLLDLDRLARGIIAPKLRPTDVGALVRRVLAESELLVGSRMRTDIEPVVVPVDGAKVERVVENLLANTARYTPDHATIWVSVRPFEGGVVLAVEDDGPGVEPALRETIFEPFQQGPDVPQYSPGVGVGLTLVKRFAELHGGQAWVGEREGGGASFRVFLPGNPPVAAEISAE